MSRLGKSKVSMACLMVIALIMVFAFVVPAFYPYSYTEQIQGANNLLPFGHSDAEQMRIEAGEKVFPHVLGTDKLGRDYAARVMMGSRISLLVGILAAGIILVIGFTYGSIAAFAGGGGWIS